MKDKIRRGKRGKRVGKRRTDPTDLTDLADRTWEAFLTANEREWGSAA